MLNSIILMDEKKPIKMRFQTKRGKEGDRANKRETASEGGRET